MTADELRLTLPATTDAPALARRALTRLTATHTDGETRETVELLVSELVTNSVRHGRLPPDAAIEVEAAIADDLIRVVVTDPGGGFGPGPPPEPEGSGWGLRLTAHLADRWGITSDEREATRVWFEVRAAEG